MVCMIRAGPRLSSCGFTRCLKQRSARCGSRPQQGQEPTQEDNQQPERELAEEALHDASYQGRFFVVLASLGDGVTQEHFKRGNCSSP